MGESAVLTKHVSVDTAELFVTVFHVVYHLHVRAKVLGLTVAIWSTTWTTKQFPTGPWPAGNPRPAFLIVLAIIRLQIEYYLVRIVFNVKLATSNSVQFRLFDPFFSY